MNNELIYKSFFEDVIEREISCHELLSGVLQEVREKLSGVLGRTIKPCETVGAVIQEYYDFKKEHM